MVIKQIQRLIKNKHFFKYFIAGVTAFVIDTMTFFIARNLVHRSIAVSNVCSFVLAATTSFLLNHFWVFERHKNNPSKKSSFAKSAVLYVVNALIVLWFSTHFITIVSHSVSASQYRGHLALAELIAKAVAIGIVIIWNFTIYKLVIFKGDKSEHTPITPA